MKVQNLTIQQTTINNVTQRTIGHLGGKGTGKTTLIGLALDALPRGMPAVVFDPLNVVKGGDRKYLINNKSLSYGSVMAKIVNGDLKKGRVVVMGFDNLLSHEVVPFMDDFIPDVRLKHGIWFFDEIHEFTPQQGGAYSYETERLIRHTRNDDNGVWMTTQRPAFVAKKVLALSDYLLLFRLTYPNDLEVIDKLVAKTNRRDEVIQALPSKPFLTGYALDYDPKSGKYA